MHERESRYMFRMSDDNAGCLTAYALKSLQNSVSVPCGHCSRCAPHLRVSRYVSNDARNITHTYWNKYLPAKGLLFAAKIRYADGEPIPENLQTEDLWALSYYGYDELGKKIRTEKYHDTEFSDSVMFSVTMFLEKHNIRDFQAITYAPSLKRAHVPLLAERLSRHFGIECIHCFSKQPTATEQKNQLNATLQHEHAQKAYKYTGPSRLPQNMIFLDDILSSGETVAVCGKELRMHGCAKVQPVLLSSLYINRKRQLNA